MKYITSQRAILKSAIDISVYSRFACCDPEDEPGNYLIAFFKEDGATAFWAYATEEARDEDFDMIISIVNGPTTRPELTLVH